MRNALDELPVLLCCIRGGLAAGAFAALLRLPRGLVLARRRGRRLPPALRALLSLADVTAAAGIAFALGATLIAANGGELRLYALIGFFAGAFFTSRAVRRLFGV